VASGAEAVNNWIYGVPFTCPTSFDMDLVEYLRTRDCLTVMILESCSALRYSRSKGPMAIYRRES